MTATVEKAASLALGSRSLESDITSSAWIGHCLVDGDYLLSESTASARAAVCISTWGSGLGAKYRLRLLDKQASGSCFMYLLCCVPGMAGLILGQVLFFPSCT